MGLFLLECDLLNQIGIVIFSLLGESLSFTLHAEQSAVVNAWSHGETNINFINVGGSPCGYCLQFLNELNQADSLIIINPKGKNYVISDLLTLPFGPKNLNG